MSEGFKSESHRRRWIMLMDQGIVSKEEFETKDKATNRAKLLPRSPQRPKSMKPKYAKVIR